MAAPDFTFKSTPDQSITRLAREIKDGDHTGRVREDFRHGVRAGVNGTPTFFINGERYDGATGLEPLLAALAARFA